MASTVQQRLNEVAAVGQEIAETGVAYLDGKFTPLADAKVSIATHALQYGRSRSSSSERTASRATCTFGRSRSRRHVR